MHIFKMGKTIKEEEEKRKSQIVSLSWNLVPRLIRICRIYLCSHFLFSAGNTLLGQNGKKKIKIVSLSRNYVQSLTQTCRMR